MIAPRVEHNGEDITRFILKEGFQKSIDESFQGRSKFEVRLSPFSFIMDRYNSNIIPQRKDRVKIRHPETGQTLVNGIIDSIEKETSNYPKVNSYPIALVLKDTNVGTKVDTGNDEEIYEFDTETTKHVRTIISDVISDVNTKEGTSFSVDATTCPEPDGSALGRFFGNKLMSLRRGGFLWGLAGVVFGTLLGDGFRFRKNGSDHYLIHKDAGLHFKKVWDKAEWVNISFKWSKKVLGVNIGFDFGSVQVPHADIYIPTIGAKYDVYKCISGGLTHHRTHEFYPLFPFFDSFPNLDQYGTRITTNGATNVNSTKINSFMKEKGLSNNSILASFDLDSGNTYVLAKGHKYNDLSGHNFILSFETPFDFYYRCTYRNAKAWDILHDLAVVTNRTIYIDADNKVWFMPQSMTIDTVTIQPKNILKYERKRFTGEEQNIHVTRYKNRDGEVQSYGIELRDNEWDAVKTWYQEESGAERIEDTYNLWKPPATIALRRTLKTPSGPVGNIISKKFSLMKSETEIVVNVI